MAIEFEDTRGFTSRAILSQEVRPKMLDIILKSGVVKSEKSAIHLLVVSTLIFFALSIFIFANSFKQNEEPDPASLQEMHNIKVQ